VMGLLPPPRSNIHRMSNGGRARAVTIHTYGDPGTRARVFDPQSGAVSVVELEFHNSAGK
jgi:predicted metal-dependent enzyme (double-stranded beta helix superfamily)